MKNPNLFFKIVVTYRQDDKRCRKFVGISGLEALVGRSNSNKAFQRAFAAGLDKCTIKLRRGVKIEIYSK